MNKNDIGVVSYYGILGLTFFGLSAYSADNEIYVEQSGATANIDFDVSVEGDIDRYLSDREYHDFWGNEPPSDLCWVDFQVNTDIALTLILKADTYEVLSSGIDEIDGDFACIEANPHYRRNQ